MVDDYIQEMETCDGENIIIQCCATQLSCASHYGYFWLADTVHTFQNTSNETENVSRVVAWTADVERNAWDGWGKGDAGKLAGKGAGTMLGKRDCHGWDWDKSEAEDENK